jgi:hypothetical protein
VHGARGLSKIRFINFRCVIWVPCAAKLNCHTLKLSDGTLENFLTAHMPAASHSHCILKDRDSGLIFKKLKKSKLKQDICGFAVPAASSLRRGVLQAPNQQHTVHGVPARLLPQHVAPTADVHAVRSRLQHAGLGGDERRRVLPVPRWCLRLRQSFVAPPTCSPKLCQPVEAAAPPRDDIHHASELAHPCQSSKRKKNAWMMQ